MTTFFDTEITRRDGWLCGPLRAPAQMLAEQTYDGHKSLHDDAMAEGLGFRAGPIEGPTHFSQFEPLAHAAFGDEWLRTGCISAHFRNMVVEGEECRAFLAEPDGGDQVAIRMEKADGTEVLVGTASIGTPDSPSAVRARLAGLTPPDPRIILRDVEVGMTRPATEVRMAMDDHMGDLYPFTLADKLAKITEPSPLWEGDDAQVPLEMFSVLTHHLPHVFPVRGPVIGLFADLEVRRVNGPLMAGEALSVSQEIIALSGSRRTESMWVESIVTRPDGEVAAITLLNSASLKDSFAGYAEEAAEAA